ncbi:MAG: hypothetical protein FWF09_07760 [Bacteroidales bacterium]|nr:hypothetical protein [Bacteroidales bacterium]
MTRSCHSTNPIFYDKNRTDDYQQLIQSSEHDWAMPDAIDCKAFSLSGSCATRHAASLRPELS